MELTRFELQNQAIQRRIAQALERIATVLEMLPLVDASNAAEEKE